jgi:peroxiredoxin
MSFQVKVPAFIVTGMGGSLKRGRKSYTVTGGDTIVVATRAEADDIAAHIDGQAVITVSAAGASTITSSTQHIRAFQPNPAIVTASEPDSILETRPGQLSGQYV